MQTLVDIVVVLALFSLRFIMPFCVLVSVGLWLERKLRPEDYSTTAPTDLPKTRLGRLAREMNALPSWLPIIVMIMIMGGFAGLYRLAVGLGTATNLNQGYPWGLWIGFDLFMVAFSGGAFTLATIVYVLNLRQYHAAIRPTVLTGLLGYSSVLLILMMDLGRWDRFYHFLIYPNINSALFEVSWCILLYTTVLFAEFSPVALARTPWQHAKNFVKKLPIPLAIIGATLSSLHQSSLGTLFVVMSERVHPLWYTPILPLLFFISSVAAGLAMVVAGGTVSFWVFKRSLSQKLVGGLASFIPWVLGVYVLIKFLDLFTAGDPILTSGPYSVLFMAELVIGVVIPMTLFSLRAVRASRTWSLVAAMFTLLGIFMNRFDVAWLSLRPVAGYDYFPSISEILIQAGVVAAIIFVYTLVGHYLPLFEELPEVEEPSPEQRLQLQHGY